MNEENSFAVVRKPSSAVEKAAPGAKRILSGMVADTLALAKPVFTVLLGDSLMPKEIGNGMFGEIVESVIKLDWQEYYSLKFIHFKREVELLKLTKDKPFDLIFLYVSNVEWEAGNPTITQDFSAVATLLGQLKEQYSKPIIATQGDDLTQSFEGTGVVFLNAPFNVEQLRKIVGTLVLNANKVK